MNWWLAYLAGSVGVSAIAMLVFAGQYYHALLLVSGMSSGWFGHIALGSRLGSDTDASEVEA